MLKNDTLYIIMSIVFVNDPMPTEGDADTYICLYPSTGLKKCNKDETYLSQMYQTYPHADYYEQYNSSGTRGAPGEFKKYQSSAVRLGLINMYVKIYPGSKTYANDNPYLRIKNFSLIFQQLAQCQDIKILHLEIPSVNKGERQEYLSFIEDYLSTSKLHGNSPTIYVHGESVEKKPPVIEKKSITISAKPKAQTTFKLEFEPNCLNTVMLYEVDFVQGNSTKDDPVGVLQYFPTDPKWDRLITDAKLQHISRTVQDQLTGILGQDNIFPPTDDLFNAFTYLKQDPKVVILGQDPYHGPGQAHGLSFSVKKGINIPPSLRVIYNALENDPDVTFIRPTHGCLTEWAEQGVILLNTALTVEQKKPKSHSSIWAPFTDRLIELLSMKYEGLIFVLWGNDAKKKSSLITGTSHVILEYNHPSPALPGNTFGTTCRHFSLINQHLVKKGKPVIDWNLTS
jgi:uracil-DNA glycosylase